jgi:hypothetical protein
MIAPSATIMHTQIMEIAPDQAMRWLDGNVHNRPLDHKYVDYLVQEIKAGRWKLMHQGIAFDSHGVLLDGQHRLWAIALSGVTVQMNVTFGAPADSLEYLDSGKLRTRSERMSLNNRVGLVRTAHLAVLRAMVRGLGVDCRLSYSAEVELLAKHRPVIDFALGHLATSRIKGVSASATCAVVARAWYCARDLARLERFCEVLRTGKSRGTDEDVVILLRDYLSTRDRSQTLANFREHYGKVERALTAFLRGQSVTILRPCVAEMFPLPGEKEAAA